MLLQPCLLGEAMTKVKQNIPESLSVKNPTILWDAPRKAKCWPYKSRQIKMMIVLL